MTATETLEALRDALAAVPGVGKCRIGMEANITPADWPLVRLVPSTVRDSEVLGRRSIELLVYFGVAVHEFTGGLEALYADLFAMEAALLAAAFAAPGVFVQYQETVLDEDRLDAYKLMALRVTAEGWRFRRRRAGA